MNYRSTLLAGVAVTLATSFGGATLAAAAAPEAAPGDILVTARRHEESLQKVPIAITAFSQQTLKEKSVSNIFDLDRAVPGLSVIGGSGTTAQASFAIRGRGLDYGTAAGSVETYFADVPVSGPFQMPSMGPTFFDLQSVQVLKGPQGTLFGRSTTGGAVLFVPQAPSDHFGGYVRAQVGNYKDYQVEGAINIPFADGKAALRVAGFEWSRAGYGRTLGSVAGASAITGPITDVFGNQLPPQTYDNQNVQGFRATLKLHPTEALTNSTIFAYNRNNNRTTPKAAIFNPLSQLGGGELFLYPYISTLPAHVSAPSVNLDHAANHNFAFINTTSFKLTPDITAKNIFGYINAKGFTNQSNDVDGSGIAGIDLPTPPRQSVIHQYTDELQIQGHSLDDHLSWIVGGLVDLTRAPGGNNINLFTLNYSGHFDALWQQHHNNTYALFGSATYKLTDKLSITAGERHSWYDINVFSQEAGTDSKLTSAQQAAAYAGNVGLTPGGAATTPGWIVANPGSLSATKFQGDTYNVALEFKATPDTLVYGGYRRGFKPGGFNAKPPVFAPNLAKFNPETDDDFYIGVKDNFSVGGMPGHFNLEGYWDLYHGKQVSFLTLANSNGTPGLATVTLNVAGTTYRGLDADASLDPSRWLRVSASYSLVDAYFTNWIDNTLPGSTLNLAVNPVANAPKNKLSVTARLHTELAGDKGEIAVAPSISYNDQWYATDLCKLLPAGESSLLGPFDSLAHGGCVMPGHTQVDIRVEWNRLMGSKINAAFNMTNLNNAVYAIGSTGTLPFGVESRSYGAPRMFTFELSTKF